MFYGKLRIKGQKAMFEILVIVFLIVGIAYFVGGQKAAAGALSTIGNIGCFMGVIGVVLIIAFFVWLNSL